MIRQWYLLMIALFISVMIMKSVNAHSDDDDNDDDNDDDDKDFDHKDYKDDYDYDDDDDNDYHKKHDHDDEGHCMTYHRPSKTQSDTCSATPNYPLLGIDPTDGEIGPRICDGIIPDEAFYRFNAIFFGDFYTYGGTDILGPLAVKGAFHAPDYVVNANKGQDCSKRNSLDSYGLVVGGAVDTKNTQVHGAVYVANGGNLADIQELEAGCVVTNSEGTGLIDFNDLEAKALDYSFRLASQRPTLQLGLNDEGIRLGPTRGGMEFITFNSCNPSSVCENIWPGAMSDPSEVLFGMGNYNGIQGTQPDPGITYVFNIPVVESTTITINTNNPTQGFNGCRVLINFYPVKVSGDGYSDYAAFTIVRNTASPLNGLILAPKGNIRDGPVGNFDGAIIARSYTWAFTNGVEIHDFRAGGGDCDNFEGCTPDTVPDPDGCTNIVVSIESRTVTSDRTVTEISTKDVTFTEGTVTLAEFTTTVANTVTTEKTATVDRTVFNTILLLEESTVTTTVANTITETILSTTPVTTTTTKETTSTLATTTTKTQFATVVTESDTTYTEMNTETTTLLLPTTLTTIATDTVVKLIYDTVTIKDVISTTVSTKTETRETLSVSTLTDTSTVFPSVCTVTTSTHTHDTNCGHEYHEDGKKKYNYYKYQEGKHDNNDEDDDYEDSDKDYDKDKKDY